MRRLVSAREMLDRSRQAASRWLERRGLGDLGEPWGARLLAQFSSPPDSGRLVQGPFYAAFDDPQATRDALRQVDPGFEASLRMRADRILAGRYDLLGFRDLSFGNPVDWRLDPTTGVRAPEGHWSEIDFLDPRVVGDHKVIWELGRHQPLLVLAQAWFCTGESRYADGCLAQLRSFLDANPPKRSVHWASSLEVAFRSITWIWVLALAGDRFPEELRLRVLAHLAVAGRHVENHLSRWFSPNTHLTGEALGLFVLGTALPQLRGADRWRETGSTILLEWLRRHVRDDGTYVEQSTWYHRYTTDFYLHFLILTGRSSWNVRGDLGQPITGLLETLAWLTRPDGTMPLIGDDDGGRLLFLDEGTAHQTRTPLAIGATLFNRCDLAGVAGGPTTELVWLLGPEGLQRFRGLPPALPRQLSRSFPHGGLHVIRSGWTAGSSVMFIDAGPHGFMNGGHAHADALSIDLSLQGQQVFVDPGTFTYTASPQKRDHFRGTSSHSAAIIDGRDSAAPAGPFQWASQVTARGEAWYDTDEVALFTGRHDGFEAAGIRYARSVVFIRPDLWIVRDEVHGAGEHELAVHWQCAPGVRAIDGRDHVTLQLTHGTVDMRVVENEGQWAITEGAISPTYGDVREAPLLKYRCRREAPFAVTTVIGDGVTSRVASIRDGNRLAAADVSWGHRRGILVAAQSSSPDWVETDAALAWIEARNSSPRLISIAAALVSRVTVQGDTVLSTQTRLPGFSTTHQSSLRETRTKD